MIGSINDYESCVIQNADAGGGSNDALYGNCPHCGSANSSYETRQHGGKCWKCGKVVFWSFSEAHSAWQKALYQSKGANRNQEKPKLTPEAIEAIEQSLAQFKHVEVGVKNGKLIVWEVNSKTKYEKAIT